MRTEHCTLTLFAYIHVYCSILVDLLDSGGRAIWTQRLRDRSCMPMWRRRKGGGHGACESIHATWWSSTCHDLPQMRPATWTPSTQDVWGLHTWHQKKCWLFVCRVSKLGVNCFTRT